MNVENLIKLVDAGFTKDEIIRLSAIDKQPPKFDVTNSEPEPVKEPEKVKPAEPVEKTESAEEKINAAIEKALKPFEQLYNNMAKLAAMPSLESVEPKGIDDIVNSFFEGD